MYCKSPLEKIGFLEKLPIPHLNLMERMVFVTGDTTIITPNVWPKQSSMCARRLLTTHTCGHQCNWFMLEKFDKNAMSLTNILFKEFILSLSGIVWVNLIQRNVYNTFPKVWDCFGTWLGTAILPLSSTSMLGDQALFFKGDAVQLCNNTGSEPLTGTWDMHFPCRVSFIVTSYMSAFEFKPCNLGIVGCAYGGRNSEVKYRMPSIYCFWNQCTKHMHYHVTDKNTI